MRQSTGHVKAMRIFLSNVPTSLFLFLLLFIIVPSMPFLLAETIQTVCPIHQIDRHLSPKLSLRHCYSNMGSCADGLVSVVDSFEVQLLISETSWQTASSTVGKEAVKGLNEIQIITTRADVGEQISDGWFRLSLHHKGLNDFDPETATMTDRMPYNASALEVKYQLDMLANIQFKDTTTHVTRSLVDAQGGYRWAVSFELVRIRYRGRTNGCV